jgi:hypothetical protein
LIILLGFYHPLVLGRGLVGGTEDTEKGDFLENRETTILQRYPRLSAKDKFT